MMRVFLGRCGETGNREPVKCVCVGGEGAGFLLIGNPSIAGCESVALSTHYQASLSASWLSDLPISMVG